MANKYYNLQMVNEVPTFYIYQPIGDDGFGGTTTPMDFAEDLKKYPETAPVCVRINSPGGSVTDGLAIYNLLNKRPGKVTCIVDGLAASMASVAAMAADDLQMPKGSFLMIHNPWTVAMGDAKQLMHDASVLSQMQDTLAGIYASKTGKDVTVIKQIMDAETWIDGETAVAQGWADTLVDDLVAVASIKQDHLTRFPNVEGKLKSIMDTLKEKQAEQVEQPKAVATQEDIPVSTEVPAETPAEVPVAQTVKVEVSVEVCDESGQETPDNPNNPDNPDMPTIEEDPFAILEAKIEELNRVNAELKAKLEEALKDIGKDKSELADVKAQLSIKEDALNKVSKDRDEKAKSLKDLQVKHAKSIAGFKFVPEKPQMTWEQAMKNAGSYVKAREMYPEVFNQMMSNRQKK